MTMTMPMTLTHTIPPPPHTHTVSRIACSYADLPKTTKVGGIILVADGALVLKVTEIKADSVMGAWR
jgi:pyruvate kinase